MTQYLIIMCVNKVLLKNKNGKYVYEIINNNYNLSTYITNVMT